MLLPEHRFIPEFTHFIHVDTFWAFDLSIVQKKNYRLDILFKTNPMIVNLTWYDCDISSRGSKIYHKKGPRKLEGGGGGGGRLNDKGG